MQNKEKLNLSECTSPKSFVSSGLHDTNNSDENMKIFKLDRSTSICKNFKKLKNKNIPGSGDLKTTLLSTITARADEHLFFREEIIETEECEQSTGISGINDSNKILIETPDMNTLVLYAFPESLNNIIQKAEDNLLWHPTRIQPPPVNFKNQETSVRNLSEEGLYLPQVPKAFYQNILEQRLSLDNTKWLNCGAHIKTLKTPLSSNCYRSAKSNLIQLQTPYMLPKYNEKIYDNVCTSNILEINIVNINFEHHPLFSAEHVFEKRLLSLYDSYKEECTRKGIERANKKLEALRTNFSRRNKINQDIYMSEVKQLRETLFKESKEYRNNIKLIIHTWKIIKKIRGKNAFSNTSIRLTIYKENCNFERENKLWKKNINQTVSEIKMEKLRDYEERVNFEVSTKPKSPSESICEEEIKAYVIKQFEQSFKPPGEPILKFSLSCDNEISTNIENVNEVLRRSAVQKTKLYTKVTYDEIDVCKSKLTTLHDAFSCFIDETFSLQLSHIPSRMCIEIYEQSSTMMKRKIGEVPLQISPAEKNYDKERILESTFVKEEFIHYKHEGVGSGHDISHITEKYITTSENLNLYTRGSENLILHTCGSIRYYVTWTEDNKTRAGITKLYKNSSDDVKWTNNMKLDPENPKNVNLFEYLSGSAEITHYPTQKLSSCNAFVLYGAADVENNLRFQTLELRNGNELDLVAMAVANNIKESQFNVLSAFKKRFPEESKPYTQEIDFDKTIQEQRVFGKKYLRKVYTKIFQQCISAENNLEYEDVVDEKHISYFENLLKTLTTRLLNMFTVQTGIKKTLFNKTDIITSEDQTTKNPTSTKVIVDIVSALNIPQRSKSKTESKFQFNIHESDENVYGRTFIEVTYQHITFRTALMDGVNPKWNEQLIFHLQSSNTNFQNPDGVNDFVILNLFQEFTGISTEIKSTNWLGYIRIPLFAIYYNSKIEGFFRVSSPILNISEQCYGKTQNSSNSTTVYVFLKLRIETTTPKLAMNMAELPSGELSHTWKFILEWNEKYNAMFPRRKFSAFAIDINGKTVCLTRFIAPLEPPKIHDSDFSVTPEQLARYISLIPFTCSNKLYDHVCLTVKQMLNFTLGSIIDHAIALTCHFLAINVEAKLLLGHGLPDGSTAYVLVRELNDNAAAIHFVVFDVVTATKYNVTDPHCPLQNVFAAVNDRNIWANIQGVDELILTRFDFTSRSDWHPLFRDQMIGPLSTMQERLTYILESTSTKELEFQIDKKIRKTIAKLRKTEETHWNYYVSGIFKDTLMKSEDKYFHGKLDVNAYVQSIQETQINGYVMSLPYVNVSTICDFIKYSKINQDHPVEVEFASAVHIHSYPNKIFAVWLFVGCVIFKQ